MDLPSVVVFFFGGGIFKKWFGRYFGISDRGRVLITLGFQKHENKGLAYFGCRNPLGTLGTQWWLWSKR